MNLFFIDNSKLKKRIKQWGKASEGGRKLRKVNPKWADPDVTQYSTSSRYESPLFINQLIF